MTTYQRGHVIVDDNFARFGSKSYAINKITSVDVRVHEKRRIGWLVFGIVGGLLLFAGLGSLSAAENGGSITCIIIGAVCLLLAFNGFRKRLTRTFELMLATAAGEVQATTALDEDAIQELRDAIENRIAARP